MNNEQTIPAVLRHTYRLLSDTFPGKIEKEDYLPVLFLLGQGMSHRSIAEVVSLFTGKEVAIVLNDVYRALMPGNVLEKDIDRVRIWLQKNGYQAWLEE